MLINLLMEMLFLVRKSLKILEKTNEELGFGIAFEGNDSKDLKALFNIEEITPGKIFYIGYKTKTST
jgi:hypothetical protein